MTFMEQLHRRAGERFTVTPLEKQDVYRHYEDEEFGVPPFYRVERLSLQITPMTVWLVHELDRRGQEPRFDIRFWPYGKDWHVVSHAKLREAMRRLGMTRNGAWEKRFAIGDGLVDAALDTLACLSKITFELIRTSDLPSGVAWPDVWLRDAILSSERISLSERHPTYTTFAVVNEHGPHDVRVPSQDVAFVEWWMSRLADG